MYFFEYLAALLENTMGEKLVYFHDRAVEYHEKRSDGRSLTKRQKRTLNTQAVSALKWTFQVKIVLLSFCPILKLKLDAFLGWYSYHFSPPFT